MESDALEPAVSSTASAVTFFPEEIIHFFFNTETSALWECVKGEAQTAEMEQLKLWNTLLPTHNRAIGCRKKHFNCRVKLKKKIQELLSV